MAINFLNTVDLNKNQLNFAVIQNLGTDPATGLVGQIIFNTTADTLKQYVADTQNPPVPGAKTPGWVEVGASSAVEDFTNANGTYVSNSITNTKATGNVSTGIVDLSAVDGTSVIGTRFLSKDNTWDVVSNVAPATATTLGTVKLFSDTEQTVAATAVSATAARTYGVQFNAADQMVVNVPWTDTNVVTYTLPVTAGVVAPGTPTTGKITLTGSDGNNDVVTFTGTTNRVTVAGNAGTSAITVDLTDDVTIVDNLTVGGVITNIQSGETNTFSSKLDMGGTGSVTPNKIINLATGTAATDAVNLGQVELLVAGVGVFQGSYNAATNTPALEGASNVALDQGDYFVVSVAGTFLGEALEPGDFIFANNAIAAGSSPNISNYTVVQADDNIAGSGATDGATQKGVAGFDSANFDVSVNGWVQLSSQRNPYGRKQPLNNTAPSSRAEAGGETTFTLDLASATLFGTGTLSQNVTVEVTDGSAPFETVYAHVNRSGSASMTVAFSGSIANNTYQVLLTHV
jgi:hypothetical protein